MARRALMLREGRAPVWDRLLTMIFLAGLVHGLIIVGITFTAAARSRDEPPGLEVLLVSDELPEADRNETATYLAQRTQKGSGNTRKHVSPHNRASSLPTLKHAGTAEGDSLKDQAAVADVGADEHVLTTSGWSTRVMYVADAGNGGEWRNKPLLLDAEQTAPPGPDEDGPVQLQGPNHDELWITPDTRAAALAPYLNSWRIKIERIGTLHFPRAASSTRASASPVVAIAIAADGKIVSAEIRHSSGDPALDQAALETLKLASPFDPFPPDLAQKVRVLHFAYEWQFSGGRAASGAVSVP